MVQTTVGGSLGETDDDLRWLVDYIQTNMILMEKVIIRRIYTHSSDETIMEETDERAFFYQIRWCYDI